MKIIDAHCHIHKPQWVRNSSYDDYIIKSFNINCSEEEILLNMDEAKIETTIIFPMPSVEIDLETANLYTINISKSNTGKFIPFTVIDESPEKWFNLGSKGFKEHTFGLRIQKDKIGNNIFSQKFKNTYKFMEKNNIPLLLHAGINRVDRIKKDILKDTPKLIVILAHIGTNYPPNKPQIDLLLNELKHFKNIYYDISTIKEIEIIKNAINFAGIDQIIFGSDFPYEKPIVTLKRVDKLNLTIEEKEKMFYKNINKILGGIN